MYSRIPSKVKICECWARDGLQGEAAFLPTDVKVSMINRFAEIGFKRIEVTSFAHPKLVRQFSDCMEVLQKIRRQPDVTYVAVVPNEKGLERAFEACDKGTGIQEITAIISASESHLLANLERTFEEVMPPLGRLVARARSAGLKVIGCIGTAFGCPLAGDVSLQKVIELTEWYLDKGATSIMLGDTTGEANPAQVHAVFSTMREKFPDTDFIAHFHDTRGMGLANTLAALHAGIVYHDTSFGGIGGQPATNRPPYHKGLTGNAATEDAVCMFNDMGIDPTMEDTFERLASDLDRIGLVYIHLVDHSSMGAPEVKPSIKRKLRAAFHGTLILSGGYDRARAEADLVAQHGDLIAFGRPFIANPKLVTKLRNGSVLLPADPATFYSPGEKGYIDYPA